MARRHSASSCSSSLATCAELAGISRCRRAPGARSSTASGAAARSSGSRRTARDRPRARAARQQRTRHHRLVRSGGRLRRMRTARERRPFAACCGRRAAVDSTPPARARGHRDGDRRAAGRRGARAGLARPLAAGHGARQLGDTASALGSVERALSEALTVGRPGVRRRGLPVARGRARCGPGSRQGRRGLRVRDRLLRPAGVPATGALCSGLPVPRPPPAR